MATFLWALACRLFWKAIERRIKAAAHKQHPAITAAGLLAVQLVLA